MASRPRTQRTGATGPAALDRARRDATTDGMPPYLFTRGLAPRTRADPEEALEAIRRPAEIDDFPTAWLDVAELEAELGDTMRRATRSGARCGLASRTPRCRSGR